MGEASLQGPTLRSGEVTLHTRRGTCETLPYCRQDGWLSPCKVWTTTAYSEHRFPAPSSLKEGCRKPVLGVCHRSCVDPPHVRTHKVHKVYQRCILRIRVQELCESWAPVPNKPTVSVDVKQHFNNNNNNNSIIKSPPPLTPRSK